MWAALIGVRQSMGMEIFECAPAAQGGARGVGRRGEASRSVTIVGASGGGR